MKYSSRIIALSILMIPSMSYAGFNWGGSGGSCSGSGDFKQQILNNAIVTVGDIPSGKKGVYIKLSSTKDVDVQLYDKSTGEKIVHWPDGILRGAGKQNTNYKGVSIEWSGYNGDGTGKGHEYIKISGTTNRTLEMKAYGYQSGFANIDYSWTGTQGCTEGGGASESGSGTFQQQILNKAIVTVGDIPKGINNLSIQLRSSKDVDIQLYDKDDGTKIIVWPDGILKGAGKQTTNYRGMNLEWSGYNGDGTGKGHEYIKISGKTERNLIMKAYGYEAGYATVNYSWGSNNLLPDGFDLSILSELYTEYTVHESVFSQVSNLLNGTTNAVDNVDNYIVAHANPNGFVDLGDGSRLITYWLDSSWGDNLGFNNSFNTVYDENPSLDDSNVFEVVSVTDEGGTLRGTNNRQSYYFTYDGLNDWNGGAISIEDWVNYLERISQVYGRIGRLTVFAHGNSGLIHMSDSFQLTTNNVENNNHIRNQLRRLRNILTDDAHILLFSCLVGSGNNGENLVQELATLTNSTVHANSQSTGNITPDGDVDWTLDVVRTP